MDIQYKYNGMSNRAVDAIASGLISEKLIAKKHGIPRVLIRAVMTSCEWHHVGAKLDKTEFYEPEEVAKHIVFCKKIYSEYKVWRKMQKLKIERETRTHHYYGQGSEAEIREKINEIIERRLNITEYLKNTDAVQEYLWEVS